MSNDKTQTALESYISKITRLEFWVETKQITWKEYDKEKYKLLEKAKEMEKLKAFEIFKAGQDSMEEGGKGFENYYEQTYGFNK
jgi:hypothetical protein